MEEFIKQIRIALDNKLYYLALQSCLSLPDICASLDSEDGRTTGAKYAKWYDENVKGTSNLTGEDCYMFRCSALHQGHTQNQKSRYSRIIFVEPSPRFFMHNNVIMDVLNIDINVFCNSILNAVEDWLTKQQDNPQFLKNYELFIRRYPDGIAPFMVGIPVIS